MNILALDPATSCGFAVLSGNEIISGTWDLSIRRDESAGMRLLRLKGKLNEIQKASPLDLLVFEAARNAGPRMQGALVVQSELQGIIKAWGEEHEIPYRGYSPTAVKKHATGKGNANKQAMIDAAKKKFGEIKDDNQADALWILDLARSELG